MRIISGIQPTGVPHLGNYLGALVNWVKLQSSVSRAKDSPSQVQVKGTAIASTESRQELLYSIVDLHSVTLPHDPSQLRDNTFKMAAALLACGIDPEKSVIFVQSEVPFHCEMAWLLGCITSTSQLSRMHQWKSKSKDADRMTLGLFSYPVLMAADILLYGATHVPVGEDQLQHMELTRDIAVKFNARFGADLVVPQPILSQSARIMNLRNPLIKMSKSDAQSSSRIELCDSPDDIRLKIQKAVTDSEPYLTSDLSDRPGVRNLISVYSALTGTSTENVVSKYANMQYFTRELKQDVAELLVQHLGPIRQSYTQFLTDHQHVKRVLSMGTERATALASDRMSRVKEKLGLGL